ncbi:hypothetical protein DL763_009442 [Monosporascus cannonballus]|nr:hypothetical protein DL763_009442 [Monosporascus cannonballus]
MSSKRKFSDFNADASGQGKNDRSQTREHTPGSRPSKQKSKNPKKGKVKEGNVNWLKKRARTIERRFRAGQNLPANVQNDMERELAHHKQKISEAEDEKHRRSMIKKYHMVRFFERKKADRLAKQIRKQLDNTTDEDEIKKLKADLHIAEIDGIYARNFPYRERYISLYPVASLGLSARGGEKPEDASTAAKALSSQRPPMWKTIEEAAKKGEKALAEIRERKPAGKSKAKQAQESTSKDSSAAAPSQSKKNSKFASDSAGSRPSKEKKSKAQISRVPDPSGSTSGDESDGGFFEAD